MDYLRLLLLLIFLTRAASIGNVIKTLPGYDGVLPFHLETGYIGVGNDKAVQLWYYFTQAEIDPTEAPILIWITGGPGCSSLNSFFFEAGPLNFDYHDYDGDNFSSLKLKLNPNAAKTVNLIALDGPVGTGFSYSKTYEGYFSHDQLYADHIVEFVQGWIEEHSNYTGKIFIGGEGYSANVITIAVWEIFNATNSAWNIVQPAINLGGYVLGNPGTDRQNDFNARITYANRLSFIPDDLYNEANTICCGNFIIPTPVDHCEEIMVNVTNLYGQLNDVSVFENACNEVSVNRTIAKEYFQKIHNGENPKWCRKYILNLMDIWINEESVKEALKINKDSIPESGWSMCNDTVNDDQIYEKNITSVRLYHDYLAKHSNLRGLIYNGDNDLAISFYATQKWMHSLGWQKVEEYRAWFVDNEIAGYTANYKPGEFRVAYATIKGGGHFAGNNRPKEFSEMLQRWFKNDRVDESE